MISSSFLTCIFFFCQLISCSSCCSFLCTKATTTIHLDHYAAPAIALAPTSTSLATPLQVPPMKKTLLSSGVSGSTDDNNNNIIRKIYNPLTKRYIHQTPLLSSKQKKSKWNTFMHIEGGYIAYGGTLVPIDIDALSLWNDKNDNNDNTNDNDDETNDDNERNNLYLKEQKNEKNEFHIQTNEMESWYVVDAQIDDDECTTSTSTSTNDEYPILEQLLFVNKPPKLLTLPGKIEPSKQKTSCLSSIVNTYLQTDINNGQNIIAISNNVKKSSLFLSSTSTNKKKRNKKKKKLFIPRPCHRLDYDTSGIIAFGLCVESLRATSYQFENRQVKKKYVALVAGHVECDCGVIEYPIGKIPTKEGYNKFACLTVSNDTDHDIDQDVGQHEYISESEFLPNSLRHAKTYYKVTKRFSIPVNSTTSGTEKVRIAKYTRVELIPHTGRGHQLRLHLESIGHPILGDQLHGDEVTGMLTPRLCLHSMQLEMVVSSLAADHTMERASNVLRKVVVTSLPPF